MQAEGKLELPERAQIFAGDAGASFDIERGKRRAAGRNGLDRLARKLGAKRDAERGERRAAGRSGSDPLVGGAGATAKPHQAPHHRPPSSNGSISTNPPSN